ncbi:MAG: 2Fe-2S iron-sulfur cluster binding domain-containing protein [Acidimicrobiia bacterium]|nr:2Fe-2S iron-sulfur cluster binding domain-containing protein [Acidimicrobiia bacterium]
MTRIRLNVNGKDCTVDVAPGTFLLELLRDDLQLTGAKMCCVEGECGACTVILDDKSVNSCLVLAGEAEGARISTVEGLADGGLHPLQDAFLDNAAAQCGFCIPGQLMAAQALLKRNSDPTRSEVREALAGNLCRCGGYEQITDAVLDAAKAAT